MDSAISVDVPPVFDGTNYSWWKVAMRTFLQSRDFRTWMHVESGYDRPVLIERDELVSKAISEYNVSEVSAAKHNSDGLNAIMHAVTPNLRLYVAHCSTSKEAWETLECVFEGNPNEKAAKLQNLHVEWEDLSMADNESFVEFYHRLSNIAFASHSLGKTIPEREIVMKILRSLPSKYDSMRLAIEEGNNLDCLSRYSLFGKLRTFDSEDLSRVVPSRSCMCDSSINHETGCPSDLHNENCFTSLFTLIKRLFRCGNRKSLEETPLIKDNQLSRTCCSCVQDSYPEKEKKAKTSLCLLAEESSHMINRQVTSENLTHSSQRSPWLVKQDPSCSVSCVQDVQTSVCKDYSNLIADWRPCAQ